MGLKEFTRDDPIFVNEAVLRDNYRPEELVERDEELSEYQEALRPVINAAPPKNIFLYGQTGVGKTLATRLVLNRLLSDQENYDDLNITVVNLNCKSASSSYQVSVDLVNQFRDTSEKIPSTGYAASQVYQMLWNHINDLDATHLLVVLDEIDSIGSDDDILYELPRANDNESVDDTLVGVIGISNDFTFRDNLSARVKDSLCDEEIHFPPYDANQLRNILKQRAEKAFRDDVLDGDTIPLCSAFSAQESGSARQALKLLYKAGDLARTRDDSEVGESYVREARDLIEKGKVQDELESLPTQSQLTLFSLLQLEEEGKTPCKRSDIYERYQLVANLIDTDIVSDRTIHDRISQLRLKGFIKHDERNDGIHGGSYYLYSLDIRQEIVENALQQSNARVSDLFEA
ncbi:Cdc6/Cdc18 family protein [Haladaptatus caseinilyticus]|uniref:Cdc6/Cdc18 family protein n=1 Tax=Haladaptatus caseinilyticus TaxID=2993314 RepID=UPI00224AFEEC|nr:orc1/cdc6 family replication initiation protein [Haladaptatus caseinilyticus]